VQGGLLLTYWLATASSVETYVQSRLGVSPVVVPTTWKAAPIDPNDKTPYGAQTGSWVQVQVQHAFQPAVPFVPSMALTST